MSWRLYDHQLTVSIFQDFLVSWVTLMRRANLLGFFAAMVLICRAVPNPALSNRNDPTARGSSPEQKHSLTSWGERTTSLLSSSLNPCRLVALDLSLPTCLSAELEAPRTLSSLCADRIFKLLFTSLQLGCCKVPGAPSPNIQNAAAAPSLQGKETSRWQICRRRLWGWDLNRAVAACLQCHSLELAVV